MSHIKTWSCINPCGDGCDGNHIGEQPIMTEWDKDKEVCEGRVFPGPWRNDSGIIQYKSFNYDYPSEYQWIDLGRIDPCRGVNNYWSDNADFIARARTRWPAALDRIAELEAENARLSEALSFYADPNAYVQSATVTKVDHEKGIITIGNFDVGVTIEWKYDAGKRARDALKPPEGGLLEVKNK